MRTILSLVSAVSLALSGCVAFPELPNGARVNIYDIVNNIECDIRHALKQNLTTSYWLLGWASEFTLKLDAKNKGQGSGEIGINVPLTPETLGLTISGGPTKNYDSSGDFTYNRNLIDIYQNANCASYDGKPQESVLTGRTGAGEWLTRVAYDAATSQVCPRKITFFLLFKVTLDAKGNPKISGVEIGDGTLSVSLTGTAQGVGEHKISLAATPIPTPAPPKYPFSKDEYDAYLKKKRNNDQLYSQVVAQVFEDAGISINRGLIQRCGRRAQPMVAAVSEVTPETEASLNEAATQSLLQQLIPSRNE